MIGKIEKSPQMDMFQTPLIHFINKQHELYQLSTQIIWDEVESDFSPYYKEQGRPAVPIRKMVGMTLLKYIFDLSDEELVERWIENPYWQHFTGELFFQTKKPFDPSDFVHFRKRIGESGAEKILSLSIRLSYKGKEIKEAEVIADTTVQEKNITFPTDTKLHKKIIDQCNKIADKEKIIVRQNYKRTIKQLMIEQRFRNHPKRKKRALSAARKIKTIAGRMVRDITRKMDETQSTSYKEKTDIFLKILSQQKDTNNKIYSIHEPNVKCIAKGKEAKPYEFGNKSSFVVGSKSGIILGAMAFEENVYDGDTLLPQLNQIRRVAGIEPKICIVDRGYRGRKKIENTEIVSPKPLPQGTNNYQKQKTRKRFRRRAGIEPIIGHIKHDHRLIRNYLRGVMGDKVNTLLAASAFNIKKLLNTIKQQVKNIFHFFYLLFSNRFYVNLISENLVF